MDYLNIIFRPTTGDIIMSMYNIVTLKSNFIYLFIFMLSTITYLCYLCLIYSLI